MKIIKSGIVSVLLLVGSSLPVTAAEPLFRILDKDASRSLTAQSNATQINRPGEISANHARLNAGALDQNTQQIEISLRKDLSIVVDKQSSIISSSGSLIWHGQKAPANGLSTAQSQMANEAVLVKRPSGITGSVRINGKLFKIRPLANGVHEIVEMDESRMPQEHPPAEMQILEQTASESATVNNLDFGAVAPFASAAAVPDIKVLVAYTAAANAAVSDMQALIELAVAETNTGYSNSGVNVIMMLVHTYQVNYTESTFGTDLNRFSTQNDGVMDEVHGKRDQYGADVALIITNVDDYCGLADAIGASSSTAFAAVYHGCATGYYSFAHEVGHLQSARHNPETDPTNTPYAFGHGYRYGADGWRTIMAYNCSPSCTRINWWSNPNKTRGGVAMGTASRSDNARTLNLTAATIAGFKGETPPPPPGGNELSNGVPATGLGASTGNDIVYTLEVPSGATNISFEMSGGTGDADMYVRFGSTPTDSTYDCRPYKNGNTESCTGTQTGGTYYVRVKAYSTFSGVSLTGSYTTGGGSGGPEPINTVVNDISVSQGGWARYTVTLEDGYSDLNVSIAGGTGDADLYVNFGSQSTTSSYDCRPYKNGNTETCPFTNPAAGTWYIDIRGYRASSGVTLTTTATPN